MVACLHVCSCGACACACVCVCVYVCMVEVSVSAHLEGQEKLGKLWKALCSSGKGYSSIARVFHSQVNAVTRASYKQQNDYVCDDPKPK